MRVASALEATGAFEGPLDLDLGNLTASDPSPIDPSEFGTDGGAGSTAACLTRGRDVLQRLVADLFSLPSESDVNGRYVRDATIQRAIREAYRSIVPKGRFPVVVLEGPH